jgi:hypothetical protein
MITDACDIAMARTLRLWGGVFRYEELGPLAEAADLTEPVARRALVRLYNKGAIRMSRKTADQLGAQSQTRRSAAPICSLSRTSSKTAPRQKPDAHRPRVALRQCR